MNRLRVRASVRKAQRKFREAKMIATGLASSEHPVLAHIIPTRRCNLTCAYCNEYDQVSDPVATAEMLRRIDKLAELGTLAITFSGGEPLLHPDIDQLVRRVRERGMLASLITNGFLLSPQRIRQLNQAGLDQMQISIDNLRPDQISNKSLKVLNRKLQHLAEHAEFDVNINSVIGAALAEPETALEVARKAASLGLTYTVGILHDGDGQLKPLDARSRPVFDEIVNMDTPFWVRARYNRFQRNLVDGKPTEWHCSAGARYLYVCEDGLVHYCSQQRGTPGKPLAEYSRDDLERAYNTPKSCAPTCTISCVHQVAMLDYVRREPHTALVELLGSQDGATSVDELRFPFRQLCHTFLPRKDGSHTLLGRLGMKVLGVDATASPKPQEHPAPRPAPSTQPEGLES